MENGRERVKRVAGARVFRRSREEVEGDRSWLGESRGGRRQDPGWREWIGAEGKGV